MPHYGLFLWAVIRKPSAIFGTVCESLSALTVCGYNSNVCIYLNIQLLYGECEMADASMYLERSNRDLDISTACSSLQEERGGVSRAH